MLDLRFSANSGLEMVHGCVMVVCVLSTLTTAMDGLQTIVGELKALKDVNGVRQCATSPPNTIVTARSRIDCMRACLSDATSPPNTIVTARSRIDCMRACLSEGSSCTHGANYRADNKTCEMYSGPPASFEQVPHCIFYQVLISSLYRLYRPKCM